MRAQSWLALAGSLLLAGSIVVAARPNIVLIVGDDIGYSDLGRRGSEIRTPNLDQLGKNGMRFSQFYNMAKCRNVRM